MIPIPAVYHPPNNSIMHEWLGDEIAGEIIEITTARIMFRVEFEERVAIEQPHTVTVICLHKEVTMEASLIDCPNCHAPMVPVCEYDNSAVPVEINQRMPDHWFCTQCGIIIR